MTKEFIQIAEKIASGTATEEEILQYNRICDYVEATAASLGTWQGDKAELERSIKKEIYYNVGIDKKEGNAKVSTIKWWKWMAAAAIFILFAGSGYVLFVRQEPGKSDRHLSSKNGGFKNEILPGKQGAVLSLADGQKVILDSISTRTLAAQGNARVIKKGGYIQYDQNKTADKVVYNTLTTPRGNQFLLILADGTKVWLNAASSITYPTVFAGNRRSVKVTGEAYFEVAHNKKMPFEVDKGDIHVEVLGTHFNMNTYEDESALKVTLLEGSIRVTGGNADKIITPGQQAQVMNGTLIVEKSVDLEEVIAWRNGSFHFSGADITEIMRQISRWYNVEVVYKEKITDVFSAEIPRNTKLPEALKALEATGKLKLSIEDNKIIVMPN